MEKAGNGGAIFRNIYRDFLKESYEISKVDNIKIAYEKFIEIAEMWTKVLDLFDKAGDTQDITYINQASEILVDLSKREKEAMELLLKV
jgi:hypothetical protein